MSDYRHCEVPEPVKGCTKVLVFVSSALSGVLLATFVIMGVALLCFNRKKIRRLFVLESQH